MLPKTIKLGKKDDIVSVIKQIKNLRDHEVIFELERGSVLLSSSDNLKLLKRTGEALGKTVKVTTNDEIGMILAKKAGVLLGNPEVKMPGLNARRVARSDVKPRFSDILSSRKILNRVPEQIQKTFSARINPVAAIPKFEFRSWRLLSNNISKLFILGLVILVLVVFALAVFLPKATVTVFARSEQVTRDLEITVDKTVISADSDTLQIPGVPITREVSQTKNFSATGTNLAGTKATGTVTITNLTNNTLTLKAATTALMAGSKKYLFIKDATGIKPNGNTTGIQIIADQPGEAYNLPASTKFQIINAALGSTDQVSAINPASIGNGAATSTTVLSSADIDNAVASLISDVIAQAESDLTAESSIATKLLTTGVTKEILAKASNKDVGDAVNNFDMTLIAKVTGLAFRDSDVTSVVLAKINEVLSSDKYLLDSAQKQYTAEFKTIDIPNGHGVLAVHFDTTAAYKVDNANLAKILAGKNESEIKEILLSKPEIDNVKVEFWPKWFVHKAPRFNGKIYINTELSQN